MPSKPSTTPKAAIRKILLLIQGGEARAAIGLDRVLGKCTINGIILVL